MTTLRPLRSFRAQLLHQQQRAVPLQHQVLLRLQQLVKKVEVQVV